MYSSFLAIREDVAACEKCELCKTRKNTVFGEGNVHTDIMLVGEGPGYQEDISGRPFVGKAGQLLDKMLKAINLTRDNVYITNIVKCRPPNNVDPQPEYAAACIGYLREQIRFIRPKLIVCLGRIAASHILGKQVAITKQRGILVKRGSVLILPTYHPSALLRDETLKKDSWIDFKLIRELIQNEFEADI